MSEWSADGCSSGLSGQTKGSRMSRPKPDAERRPTITREFLERCLRQGLTQREMIEGFYEETGEGRTRAAFGNQMKRCGLEPPKERQIPRYPDHVPWSPVHLEHQNKYHLRMLRALARREDRKSVV